jgi:hypothetical protein
MRRLSGDASDGHDDALALAYGVVTGLLSVSLGVVVGERVRGPGVVVSGLVTLTLAVFAVRVARQVLGWLVPVASGSWLRAPSESQPSHHGSRDREH